MSEGSAWSADIDGLYEDIQEAVEEVRLDKDSACLRPVPMLGPETRKQLAREEEAVMEEVSVLDDPWLGPPVIEEGDTLHVDVPSLGAATFRVRDIERLAKGRYDVTMEVARDE